MPEKETDAAEPRAIERLIRSKYDDMPGSERALADRVLEYPNEVLLYSATELADRAGASKAAVSRFVKRLGYGDFREMQREIRQAQMTGDPIFLSAVPGGGQGSLSRHLECDMASLRDTIEQIDATMIEEVSRKILSARRVVCLGFRNSLCLRALPAPPADPDPPRGDADPRRRPDADGGFRRSRARTTC